MSYIRGFAITAGRKLRAKQESSYQEPVPIREHGRQSKWLPVLMRTDDHLAHDGRFI
jgi:hypothetical protein